MALLSFLYVKPNPDCEGECCGGTLFADTGASNPCGQRGRHDVLIVTGGRFGKRGYGVVLCNDCAADLRHRGAL